VAVEKLPFSQNRSKFWDRKCPGGRGKSFVELPNAFLFLPISGEPSFSTATGIITSNLRVRLVVISGFLNNIPVGEIFLKDFAPSLSRRDR
jgi:hypothetical protein